MMECFSSRKWICESSACACHVVESFKEAPSSERLVAENWSGWRLTGDTTLKELLNFMRVKG